MVFGVCVVLLRCGLHVPWRWDKPSWGLAFWPGFRRGTGWQSLDLPLLVAPCACGEQAIDSVLGDEGVRSG